MCSIWSRNLKRYDSGSRRTEQRFQELQTGELLAKDWQSVIYFLEHLMISEHSKAQGKDRQVERNISQGLG